MKRTSRRDRLVKQWIRQQKKVFDEEEIIIPTQMIKLHNLKSFHLHKHWQYISTMCCHYIMLDVKGQLSQL